MRAGKLDRRITIERMTSTPSESGEPVETWATLATVYAQVRPFRGAERFSAQQLVGKAVTTFNIRYQGALSTLNDKDRISFDGKTWDIVDVRKVGRQTEIEIDATARADL